MTRSFHFVVARRWIWVLIGVAVCWPAWAQQTLERVEITGSSIKRIEGAVQATIGVVVDAEVERTA